ncbi:helix-turn-helix domain-containing protein (plasmid) [Streptomyces avidinii]|uniref:helix-turn-helix domain-containing protein n=1 Tax=Streptomyces avidinii TaxID=1895 RepID=UPI002F915A79|nr:helix-turn-helix domain-containing protein [Streptomyces avidinii]WST50954.1 helix-turn-helix domain-containing protein [Streptomyces avidinii]
MADLPTQGTFALTLRDLRTRSALPLSVIAEHAGIPVSSLSNYVSGRILPSAETLDRLLVVLQASELESRQIRHDRRQRANAAAINRAKDHSPEVVTSRSERQASRITAIGPASQSGRPDPTPITTSAELAAALNAVHIWAGSPSLRTMQEASNGVLRRATISDMLNTKKAEETQRIPDFDRYIAFVQLCGIRDTEDWVAAWRRLKARQRPQAGGWLKA